MLFAKQAATDSEAAVWLLPSPTVGEQYMYNEAHCYTCTYMHMYMYITYM